jgi:hypothetical protein
MSERGIYGRNRGVPHVRADPYAGPLGPYVGADPYAERPGPDPYGRVPGPDPYGRWPGPGLDPYGRGRPPEHQRGRGSSIGTWIVGGLVVAGAVLWMKHQSKQIAKLYETSGLPYQSFTGNLRSRAVELSGAAGERFQGLASRLGGRTGETTSRGRTGEASYLGRSGEIPERSTEHTEAPRIRTTHEIEGAGRNSEDGT